MTKNDVNHIISHTHWDREWYLPFENYMFRLVKLFDRLLDVLDDEEINFRYFSMDGQTIGLEDYLEIKPENREKLRKYTSSGKIGIGPWYLQMSPWLQTGEGIIRNLLFGSELCKEFGTKPVNLGYVPDQFAISPQFPQIMKGFNINYMAHCRGINDQYEKLKIHTEYSWKGPDGSIVTNFQLRNSYGMAGFLPNDPIQALNMVVFARGPMEDYPRSTNQVLMFNGSDHTDPDKVLSEVIEIWNDEEDITEEYGIIKQSTWQEYFDAFWEQNPQLKTVSGEIIGHKHHFASKGVFSNRMPIKQENFSLHNLLEKYSEPFSSLSYLLGNEYMEGFLHKAWKYLLQNQPHDSSWGASPDPIIQDMWQRFRACRQIADEVFRRSAHEIIFRIDKKKLFQLQKRENKISESINFITVFNPTPWVRSDAVEITISQGKIDVSKPLILRDCMGNQISAKFIPRNATGDDRYLYRTFVPSHGPLPTNLIDIKFMARGVPALGYETYTIENESIEDELELDMIEETFVNCTEFFMENTAIKVRVEENGTLTIIDKETNKVFKNLHYFEDNGNDGCGYEYIPLKIPKDMTTLDCKCITELVEACSAYSVIKITIPWKIPYSLSEGHESRSENMVDFQIISYVKLYSGNNKRVDIKTEFINRAKWHQLRVIFPTELNVKKEFVDSHFHVFERPVDTPCDFEGSYATTGCYPQHKFMGLFDSEKKYGISIINKGLPEYETYRREDKKINIALTLFRAQGRWIGHLNLHPNISTPEAQWLDKKVIVEYSIIPLKENWLISKLHNISEEFISPLRAEEHWDVFRLNRYEPEINLQPLFSLIENKNVNIVLSAVKKSKSNNNLIIRFFNLSNKDEVAKFKLSGKISKVEFLNMNEEIIEESLSKISIEHLQNTDEIYSLIECNIAPYKINTISMEFDGL